MITPRQIRAARHLLGLDAEQLAEKAGVTRATITNIENDVVRAPVSSAPMRKIRFCRRPSRPISRNSTAARAASLIEAAHSRDYLIEELAVITLQARALPSVKLYPGGELQCLNVVRRQLVPEAPAGIQREQFAHINIETRAGAVPAIVPKVA